MNELNNVSYIQRGLPSEHIMLSTLVNECDIVVSDAVGDNEIWVSRKRYIELSKLYAPLMKVDDKIIDPLDLTKE